MAMHVFFFSPVDLFASCRVRDIRAVLDGHDLWDEVDADEELRTYEPDEVVTMWYKLDARSRRWTVMGDHGAILCKLSPSIVALVSQYNYRIGPDTDSLYVAPV